MISIYMSRNAYWSSLVKAFQMALQNMFYRNQPRGTKLLEQVKDTEWIWLPNQYQYIRHISDHFVYKLNSEQQRT